MHMWPISATCKIEHTLGSRLGRIPHRVGSQPFLHFPKTVARSARTACALLGPTLPLLLLAPCALLEAAQRGRGAPGILHCRGSGSGKGIVEVAITDEDTTNLIWASFQVSAQLCNSCPWPSLAELRVLRRFCAVRSWMEAGNSGRMDFWECLFGGLRKA